MQPEPLDPCVIVARDIEHRCARLIVPGAQLVKIAIVGISHGRKEIIRGDRLTIMAFKVEFQAIFESLFAEQGLVHANHFGTLVINRSSVEIIDLDVRIRTDRVRHWTGIFGKLDVAQQAHVINPLDGTGAHIG